MILFEIIKALQAATGSNAKQAILEAHKDNSLLKAYLKAVYDPALSYYQKKIAKHSFEGAPVKASLGEEMLGDIQYHLADRHITGRQAERWLGDLYAAQQPETKELLELLIKRSIGAGVGDTMVLKTFPGLYFIPGYMRCSLMTPKIKKHFESLDIFIIQKKADGTFCYVKKPLEGTATAFTRAGTAYPQWLVQRLIKGAPKGNHVYVGELVIYKNGRLLDRQTGNGIYNSILKNGDEDEYKECDFLMEAWDLLPICDFEAGLCEIDYRTRFETLERHSVSTENIQVIDTDFVKNLDEAYKIYSTYTADGFEGTVIKDGASDW